MIGFDLSWQIGKVVKRQGWVENHGQGRKARSPRDLPRSRLLSQNLQNITYAVFILGRLGFGEMSTENLFVCLYSLIFSSSLHNLCKKIRP